MGTEQLESEFEKIDVNGVADHDDDHVDNIDLTHLWHYEGRWDQFPNMRPNFLEPFVPYFVVDNCHDVPVTGISGSFREKESSL